MTAANKLSETKAIKEWLRTADKPLVQKEEENKKRKTKRRAKR
jgi:hypothetical protein